MGLEYDLIEAELRSRKNDEKPDLPTRTSLVLRCIHRAAVAVAGRTAATLRGAAATSMGCAKAEDTTEAAGGDAAASR